MEANSSTRVRVIRNVILCLLPLLCFVFIKPEWVARLSAATGFFAMINILVLIYGLNPKRGFFISPPPMDRKESEKEKRDRRAPLVVKILAILGGGLLLWFVTIPNLRDCIAVIQKGRSALLEIEGKVIDNQGVHGTTFVVQELLVLKNGESLASGYSALFFPQIARVGKSYRFLIAPESNTVLELAVIN